MIGDRSINANKHSTSHLRLN